MDLKFPVLRKPKYGVTIIGDTRLEEHMGCEMWATSFAIRDGIDRILLDPKSPWRDLWEKAYLTQNYNKNIDLDVFWIENSMIEHMGYWEGFTTSFVWQGIKFVDVFVQLLVGQRYYLPKILINQIKDKIDAKLSKIDAFADTFEDSTRIQWQKPTNRAQGYFENNKLDNFGKIN